MYKFVCVILHSFTFDIIKLVSITYPAVNAMSFRIISVSFVFDFVKKYIPLYIIKLRN